MSHDPSDYGRSWFSALVGEGAKPRDDYPASLWVVDGELAGRRARYIAVVPDADSRFPRARRGEVGLAEGWALARAVSEARKEDADAAPADKRIIVAIVDVPSQAYGRTEEAYGIHQALAAAAEAYAAARQLGHPVVALIVGKAMSGGFLAHGYQANRLVALSGEPVQVHAMGKQAAARITQRSVEGVEALAAKITPMAYDIDSYDRLGLLDTCLAITPDAYDDADAIGQVRQALSDAVADIGDTRDLSHRIGRGERTATATVHARMAEAWTG